MITIVPAKDHELIASLNQEVQELHHRLHPAIFKPYDKAGILPFIQKYMEDPDCRAYVAMQGDVALGYVLFFIREAKENAYHYTLRSIYIDQICVLKQFQRSGVAGLLLHEVENAAKELGIHRIELDHWTSNIIAAAAFRKNGFLPAKDRLVRQLHF